MVKLEGVGEFVPESNIDINFIEAEDEYDKSVLKIKPEGNAWSSPHARISVQGIAVETSTQPPNTDIVITVNDRNREALTALNAALEENGFTVAAQSSSVMSGAQEYTIRATIDDPSSVGRVMDTLTSEIDLGNGAPVSLMHKDVAGKISHTVINTFPDAVNKVPVTLDIMQEERRLRTGVDIGTAYVDADFSSFTGLAVHSIREDGDRIVLPDGRTGIEIHTNMEVEPAKSSVVQSTLEKANISFTEQVYFQGGQEIRILKIDSPADTIMNALAANGVMPASLADRVSSAVAEGMQANSNLERLGSADTGPMGRVAEVAERVGKNGGAVTGVMMGSLVGAFTLVAGGSIAQASEAVYETAVPYGETQLDLSNADIAAAQRSATIETVSNICAVGGGTVGAVGGSMIMPGAGTVAGGVGGAAAAGVVCGEATAMIYDHAEEIRDTATDILDRNDDRLLERLPTEVSDEALPELQHLVEIKRLLIDAEEERDRLGVGRTHDQELKAARRVASDRFNDLNAEFDEAYEMYEEGGQLDEVYVALAEEEAIIARDNGAFNNPDGVDIENANANANANADAVQTPPTNLNTLNIS